MKPISDYPDLWDILRREGIEVDSKTPITMRNNIISIGESFDKNPLYTMVQGYFTGHQEEVVVFRFISTKYAISSLRRRKLRVYNLLSQNDNDFAEASEFYLRSRLLHLLCPSAVDVDGKEPKIEQIRDNVHILCFAKSLSPRIWESYGDNKGCCLVFTAKWIVHEFTRFADVLYGADSLFDTITNIQSQVQRRYQCQIFIQGISHLAFLYKRASYSWENEIRYVLTPSKLGIKVMDDQYTNIWGQTEVRKYCEIPFNSNSSDKTFLKLELIEILTGTKADPNDVKELQSLKKQIIHKRESCISRLTKSFLQKVSRRR